jgi:hypothetical protein
MRRFLVAIVPALLLVAALAGGTASDASIPARGADLYGVGGGQTELGFNQFDLSAHSGPTGDFGHVGTKSEVLGDMYVDVNCVNVAGLPGTFGGNAMISGIIRRVDVPNLLGVAPGDTQFFLVGDNGSPSTVPVDSFYYVFGAGPGQDCNDFSPFNLSPNVEQGNIVIKNG